MRDDVMWAWDYELRTLGSWPGERYTGHNVPVEVVTKADHDAALRRAKAEGVREASGAAKKLANGVVPTAAMNALNLLGVELDARAAQIEEGE